MKRERKFVPMLKYFNQGNPHTDLVVGNIEVKVKIIRELLF